MDEYQDTNKAQLQLVQNLCSQHNNICVVGDDDQSIYSWRGAEPDNIGNFSKIFSNATIIKLEQNYRSTSPILTAANSVIRNNSKRLGKELWTQKEASDQIVHAVAASAEDEAKYIARTIYELQESNTWRYKDCAILYRSNIIAKNYEEHLRLMGIPYQMIGGQKFFDRKEVKDIIAYIRVALNPNDEVSLRRIINYPARGIGVTTVKNVVEHARKRRGRMWDSLVSFASWSTSSRAIKAVSLFVRQITDLQAGLTANAMEAIEGMVADIDLIADLRDAEKNPKRARYRIDNVNWLLRSLRTYLSKNTGSGALQDFLVQLTLGEKENQEESSGGVVMSTLHGAKGLEFPVVFFAGMEEELLPHIRTLEPSKTAIYDPETAGDISEERRLAYVGITRAKEQLYLTRSVYRSSRGRATQRQPSRFLFEIPEELLEVVDITEEKQAPAELDEVRNFFQSLAE